MRILIIVFSILFILGCDDSGSSNANNNNNTNNSNNTNNTNNSNNVNNANNTNNTNNTNNNHFVCMALPQPTGNTITVSPQDADSIRSTIENAPSGTTILFEDGYYDMSKGDDTSRIVISQDNITIRSLSGNASDVILDGDYVTGELISIYASNTTIADLTLTKAYYHPIHISGPDTIITGTLIHNVTIIDPGEQGIKINPNGTGGFTDYGTIECSHIELTDSGRDEVRNNCYTGGIDAHKSQGWVIRNNTITGFWCTTGLSEHAIHMWQSCRDTLVENNIIINCARGIGFGMGETGDGRTYNDSPYPTVGYMGHIDGMIRNNFISADSQDLFNTTTGFDAGITLEQAHGAEIYHNTVVSTAAPFSSIEWRWDNTNVTIFNNLVSHNLRDRGGISSLGGNIENAPLSWFESVTTGNLHLISSATPDIGVTLETGVCPYDIDGDSRQSPPTPGADEQN